MPVTPKMVVLTCDGCGRTFERERWRAERGAKKRYCTNACRLKHAVREEHPRWNGGQVEVPCAECGAAVLMDRHRISVSERHFCNYDCHARYRSRTARGAKSPGWRGGPLELTCRECGKRFKRARSQQRSALAFCSSHCAAIFRCSTLRGANHPWWRGGRAQSRRYYGPNWRRQRALVLRRDRHCCRVCGTSKRDLGREPDVHHIRPFDDCPSWREANQTDNLICLCTSCHNRLEGASLEAIIAAEPIAEPAPAPDLTLFEVAAK